MFNTSNFSKFLLKQNALRLNVESTAFKWKIDYAQLLIRCV